MNKKLFNPAYLKSLCEKYGLRPSKRYGQNFLISEKPINAMIEAAELKKTDTVIEIGPGFGVLTFAVAPLVERVMAFEIERKLERYWDEVRNKEINGNSVEIIWGDVLRNWKLEIGNWRSGYKVVANIPYQITSNALRIMLESENKPERIVVMVQKEVAERICAKPGEMSLLAVSVQYYGEPKIICRVPRGSFWPEPKVDSAIVLINTPTRQRDNIFSDEEFFRVVRAGFARPRKQVWRNLSAGLKLDGDRVKDVLKEIAGNEKVRAQELSVLQWKDVVVNGER